MNNVMVREPMYTENIFPYTSWFRENYETALLIDPEIIPEKLPGYNDIVFYVNNNIMENEKLRKNLFVWLYNNYHTNVISVLIGTVTPLLKIWELIWMLATMKCRFKGIYINFAVSDKKENWYNENDIICVKGIYGCSDMFKMNFMQNISDYFLSVIPKVEITEVVI